MNLIHRQTQPALMFVLIGLGAIFAICLCTAANAADPLPSWNDGSAKKAILEFVAAVTDESGKDYVEPAERIATFDNDGTLWVEYPMYTQALFAFDRVKKLAPQHPEWKTQQPFKGVLEGDMKAVGASGIKGLMEIVMATHSGMTAAEFDQEVRACPHRRMPTATPGNPKSVRTENSFGTRPVFVRRSEQMARRISRPKAGAITSMSPTPARGRTGPWSHAS
jgi:hypothetical protein